MQRVALLGGFQKRSAFLANHIQVQNSDAILATKPRFVFRTEPGHDFWMSLPRFCFCDLRKIEFDPMKKCPPEHFSKVWVAGRLNNRTAKIKRLFRRKDT